MKESRCFNAAVGSIMFCFAIACLVTSGCRTTGQHSPETARPSATGVTNNILTPEGCVIERFEVPSAVMGRKIRGLIILPPGYAVNPGKSFPILYALHGRGAPYTVWSEMAPLRAALKSRPMLVASFDGDQQSWYLDSDILQSDYLRPGDIPAGSKPEPARSLFTTFFFDEFIPWVDDHYRTDRQRRMLTGFSMGADGALRFVLQHPEMFVSVSGLSANFIPCADGDELSEKTFGNVLGPVPGSPQQSTGAAMLARPLAALPEQGDAYQRADVTLQLERFLAAGKQLPPCYLHCGSEDSRRNLTNNRAVAWLLASYGKTNCYHESPGGHTWPFWKNASADLIDFHWRTLPVAP